MRVLLTLAWLEMWKITLGDHRFYMLAAAARHAARHKKPRWWRRGGRA